MRVQRHIAGLVGASLLSLFGGSIARAQSLDVVLNPIPQAYSNTCQSYALGFAMARAGVPGYVLGTVGDVRTLEGEVRKAIESEAKRLGKTPYDHVVWTAAVKMLTSDAYVLNRKEFATFEAMAAEIGTKTGITAAGSLGPVLSVVASKTPVMTSFKKIGANSYSTGHIVTVFGLDASGGPVSAPPKLMLLNSAVKKSSAGAPAAYAPACNATELPGDLKYTGAAALEKDYQPTLYGGKYVLFWVSKK